MVYRLGYDKRAFVAQTLLAAVILPLSRLFSDPRQNINWVYGFGEKQQGNAAGPWLVICYIFGADLPADAFSAREAIRFGKSLRAVQRPRLEPESVHPFLLRGSQLQKRLTPFVNPLSYSTPMMHFHVSGIPETWNEHS